MPQLSIIIPVCNEAENIVPLTRELLAALEPARASFEIIFVDDGSTDATGSSIQQARMLDRRVRGLRHPQQFGQSAALWTGFEASSGEVLATMDGDLQNDPGDLPRLLARLEDWDFVAGIRRRRRDGWIRRVSSRVARLARKWVLGVDFCDTGCSLRVFKRSALNGVFPFNGMHRFLPVLVHGGGKKILEVAVSHRARHSGRSKYGIWNRLARGILDLLAMMWYQRRRIDSVPFEEMK